MKLISLRLLRTSYIPEAPVFHCSPISPFGKLREMNEFSAGSEWLKREKVPVDIYVDKYIY